MVILNVNDGKVKCPVCWEEVSTRTYQNIKALKEPTLLHVFSKLVDIELNDISQSRSEELEVALYQVSAFVYNQPEYFRDLPPPDDFKIGGKVVPVPKKLERLTLEQNLFLKSKINEGDVLEQHISLATATFLQPLVTGRFNSDDVFSLKNEVDEMLIEKTFPVGFFFLKKLMNFGAGGYRLLFQLRLVRLMMNWQKLRAQKHLKNGKISQ